VPSESRPRVHQSVELTEDQKLLTFLIPVTARERDHLYAFPADLSHIQPQSTVVSTVSGFVEQSWTQRSRRHSPFGFPSVSSARPGRLWDWVLSLRGGRLRRPPFGPTLAPPPSHVMLTCIRAWPGSSGLPCPGFSPATCSRRGRAGASASLFQSRGNRGLRCLLCLDLTRLPMPFAIKRAMHIHRGVKVGIGFIVTDGTAKQFPPLRDDALATLGGEPLPQSATPRAILTGPMRIDLYRDDLMEVGFVFGVLSDLAA
jgi:hypothetical protein